MKITCKSRAMGAALVALGLLSCAEDPTESGDPSGSPDAAEGEVDGAVVAEGDGATDGDVAVGDPLIPLVGSHVMISEVGLSPDELELVEIVNPTTSEVDLSDMYLSDGARYYRIVDGGSFTRGGMEDTDFLVGFPSGTLIAPGAVLVIALNPGFFGQFGWCPDFQVTPDGGEGSCDGASVVAMRIPAEGAVGSGIGRLLSNDREMLMLFRWEATERTVQDVDYLTYGVRFDEYNRTDKSAVDGYQPDTPIELQVSAMIPGNNTTLERCDLSEPGETSEGGNGLMGHDETSENFAEAFRIADEPSPGVANPCLVRP